MVQRKTRIFQQKKNNIFDSLLTNRNRSKSEGLPEVYLQRKKHRDMDKNWKKGYNQVGTFLRSTKNVNTS